MQSWRHPGEDAHLEIALRKALDKFERNVWNLRERREGRRYTKDGRPFAGAEEGFEPGDSG